MATVKELVQRFKDTIAERAKYRDTEDVDVMEVEEVEPIVEVVVELAPITTSQADVDRINAHINSEYFKYLPVAEQDLAHKALSYARGKAKGSGKVEGEVMYDGKFFKTEAELEAAKNEDKFFKTEAESSESSEEAEWEERGELCLIMIESTTGAERKEWEEQQRVVDIMLGL